MNTNTQRVIFWIPRVLCILFAIFLSLFALDVFNEGYGFGETILALIMHLIPTFIIVVTLIIAWHWEWVGAIVFNALALFLLISSRGESWVISLPLLIVGIFFLFNWIYKIKLKDSMA